MKNPSSSHTGREILATRLQMSTSDPKIGAIRDGDIHVLLGIPAAQARKIISTTAGDILDLIEEASRESGIQFVRSGSLENVDTDNMTIQETLRNAAEFICNVWSDHSFASKFMVLEGSVEDRNIKDNPLSEPMASLLRIGKELDFFTLKSPKTPQATCKAIQNLRDYCKLTDQSMPTEFDED